MATVRRWCRRGRRLALIGLLLAAWTAGATAQSLGGDAAAKAKLVATLARFVQWPAGTFDSDSAPLHLCVATGSATVERAFLGHDNTLAGTRPLQVSVVNGPVAAGSCHVLYLDDSAALSLDRWRHGHAGEPAFTVGTQDGFVSDGGMVEIVRVDNVLRFDFNLVALREAGLGINPGVLKLARQVRQSP
ncbi:MAG TPA: YfiR family protein [Burkholderiaceae bacterium]|nr:YfiR family protein [Burkholderiaceae bacterium]